MASNLASQSSFTATYQIRRTCGEQGKKWRLSDGAQTILAEIEGKMFWDRVNAADAGLSPGGYLVCDVRMTQCLSNTGLKTEYVVERVMQHIPALGRWQFSSRLLPLAAR